MKPAWITDAPYLDALGVGVPDASDPEGPLGLDEARGLLFTVREGQLRAWRLDDGSPLIGRPRTALTLGGAGPHGGLRGFCSGGADDRPSSAG